MGFIQMTNETNEMLVRCFACSEVFLVDDLSICVRCGAGVCGSQTMGCSGRCICDSLRHLEHPDDAKDFYSILDQLNVCEDEQQILYLESQLEVFEQRHGW
jgi:uncharacterized UBP type Zn finger protein